MSQLASIAAGYVGSIILNNVGIVTLTIISSTLLFLSVIPLFGIKHNVNNYIGEDALNPNYEGIVFFSDYSWYDGNVYVSDGVVTNNKSITQEQLEIKNDYVSYVAKKNDLALQYNYFKNKDEKK